MARVTIKRRFWRAAAPTLGAAIVCLGAAPHATQQSALAGALDRYASGDFAAVVDSRPLDGMTVASTIAGLEAWIGPLDEKTATLAQRTEHERRSRMAARFVIDVTAHRGFSWITIRMPAFDGAPSPTSFTLTSPTRDSPSFQWQEFNAPIVVWAGERMPRTGPVEAWEEGWWLASIALLQEAGEWDVLRGGRSITWSGGIPPWQLAVIKARVGTGHLTRAFARLGAHPRVRLAAAVTQAALLTDGRHNTSTVIHRGRPDVLRHLEEESGRRNSNAFAEAERDFEALMNEPGYEAEVALRIAQLRVLRRDWTEATRWLDRAAATSTDRVQLATVDYLRGWIFERTNRPGDALAAFRAAHARYDTSPNLNTLLATHLMMAGERSEAARVLERTVREQHDHTWLDLWWLLNEGDARKASSYARFMREAR